MNWINKVNENSSAFRDAFGEPTRWTPAGGKKKTVAGIFSLDNEIQFVGNAAFQKNELKVIYRDVDVTSLAVDDIIEIRDVTYKVRSFEDNVDSAEKVVMLEVT